MKNDFIPGGDICSVSIAFYRATGSDWGSILASTNGEEWVLLKKLDSGMTLKETNYVDVTVENMRRQHYQYLRIEQKNGASPTYVSGIALTYMKQDGSGQAITSIQQDVRASLAHDLMGRTVSRPAPGQLLISDEGLTIKKHQ